LPAAGDPVVLTVTVTATDEPAVSAADGWLSAQETPVGEPTTLQPRFTVPLNPFVDATKSFAVPVPAVTETIDVEAVREKSDSGLSSGVLNVNDDGA
jgi:hypothetical protein